MYLFNIGLIIHPSLDIPSPLKEYLNPFLKKEYDYKKEKLPFYHLEWVNENKELMKFMEDNKEYCSYIIIGELDDIEINSPYGLPRLGWTREIIIDE